LDCCPHYGHKFVAARTNGHNYLAVTEKVNFSRDAMVMLSCFYVDSTLTFEKNSKKHFLSPSSKSPRDAYSSPSPKTPTQFEEGSTEDYGQEPSIEGKNSDDEGDNVQLLPPFGRGKTIHTTPSHQHGPTKKRKITKEFSVESDEESEKQSKTKQKKKVPPPVISKNIPKTVKKKPKKN
jgi:hypothetical protein